MEPDPGAPPVTLRADLVVRAFAATTDFADEPLDGRTVAYNEVVEVRKRLVAEDRVLERLDELHELTERVNARPIEDREQFERDDAGRLALIAHLEQASEGLLQRATVAAILAGYDQLAGYPEQRLAWWTRSLLSMYAVGMPWRWEPVPVKRLRGESEKTIAMVVEVLAARIAGDPPAIADAVAEEKWGREPGAARKARERIRARLRVASD